MTKSVQDLLTEAENHLKIGNASQADMILTKLLKAEKNNFEALYLRGLCAASQQQRPLAIAHMRRCLRINNDHFNALHSLGIFALQDKKNELALKYLLHANEVEPSNSTLPSLIANAYYHNSEYNNAIPFFERSLTLSSASKQDLLHLALSYSSILDYENALSHIEKYLELLPKDTETLFIASMINRDMGNHQAAASHLESLLSIDPDHVEAHFELSQFLLSRSEYDTGFAQYEWRLKRSNAPKIHFSSIVDLDSIQGKYIHLVAEQGAGDAIHFARYIQILTERGSRVSLSCHATLVSLFQTLTYIEAVLPFSAVLPDADFIIPLMSLPHLLQLDEVEITGGTPYLNNIPKYALPQSADQKGALKVGLVWSGSSAFTNNKRRACPFIHFDQLSQLENVTFYNFQIGEFCDEAETWQGPAPLIDLSPNISSYYDTATYLQDLDILIATDTSTPHLAGSLGVPVYLLVNKVCDWRWLEKGNEWYPSFTLFQQQKEGDWSSPVTMIYDILQNHIEHSDKYSLLYRSFE